MDRFIDFDEVWPDIGWTTKQVAFSTLKRNYLEGKDYILSGPTKLSGKGRPRTLIYITERCYYSLLRRQKKLKERQSRQIGNQFEGLFS